MDEGGEEGSDLEQGAVWDTLGVTGTDFLAGRGAGDLLVPRLWCCSNGRDTGSWGAAQILCSQTFERLAL